MLELRRLVQLVKQEVPGVQQPALIIHSREDDHAGMRNLEFLQTNLGGQAEAVVLNDCYHIITLDQQRQFVVDRTIRFLSNLGRMAEYMNTEMCHLTKLPAKAWH